MKHSVLAFLSLLTFFLVVPVSIGATEFYVDDDGSNNNDGLSPTTAWERIDHAVYNELVQPGDTINVLPGNYTYSIRIYGTLSAKCGTEGNPVTLRGYDPENMPILTSDERKGRIILKNCSHYSIENFHLKDIIGGGILVHNSLPNSKMVGITIHNNVVENQDSSMPGEDWQSTILVEGGYGKGRSIEQVKITNNTIINARPGDPNFYNEVVALEGNTRYVLIENNAILDSYYIAIVVKGLTGKACADCEASTWQSEWVTIRNNYLDTVNRSGISTSAGIYIEGGNHVLVEHNLVNNAGVAISTGNEPYNISSPPLNFDHYLIRDNTVLTGSISAYAFKVGQGGCGWENKDVEKNSYVVHNVFHNGSVGSVIMLNESENFLIKNNVLHTTGNILYDMTPSSANHNWKSDSNLFFANGSGAFDWTTPNDCGISQFSSYDTYRQGNSLNDAYSHWGEPLYESPTANNYQLKDSSPGYGKAQPLTIVSSVAPQSPTTGKVVPVEDPLYFYDGWDIIDETGDSIVIGDQNAKIVDVNYTDKTITLDRDISYRSGYHIYYYYETPNPSIGNLTNKFYENPPLQPNPTETPQIPNLDITKEFLMSYANDSTTYDLNNDGIINFADTLH